MTTSFLHNPAPAAFRKRSTFKLVVYMDESSTDPTSKPMFETLVRVLWEKAPPDVRVERKPALLIGGFDAWTRFVKTKPGGELNWIEMGDGWGCLDLALTGSTVKLDGRPSENSPVDKENVDHARARFPDIDNAGNIIRSAHEYVRIQLSI